jgi:transposase
MRASSFHSKRKSRAECWSTQRDLFDHNVLSHDVADTPALSVMHVEKARCMMQAESKSRPTYGQQWHEYNLAQTNEKAKFQELLYELCHDVQEMPRKEGAPGRHRLPLGDMIFCVVTKTYECCSGRRLASDLREAQRRGYISRTPHFNSVFNYLELEEMTACLHEMIRLSSLPLKSVEVDFAVDSSGFGTCQYKRWYDVKYGNTEDWREWLKLHLMCGVKTNIVTAVEVSHGTAGDSPYFAPLVNRTAQNGFNMREVSADKGYNAEKNYRLVLLHGAQPFIPFKDDAVQSPRKTLWNRLLRYFLWHEEEFFAHYHKRSNVESTFWMIKSKFGERLRSKTRIAQTNELLCKVLAHNLCCVIQSMYELGLPVDFCASLHDAQNLDGLT